jgi:hypothetical protein
VCLRTRVISCGPKTVMKLIRCSVLAMMGSLLLLSPAFAQSKPSSLAELPDTEASQIWTLFTSHTDKFDVLLPAAPKIKQETLRINGQQLLLSFYGSRRGQSDYAVLTLSGFNDADWQVAHMLMLDLYCRRSSSLKAIFQREISLDGFVGKQFRLEGADRVGEWRIYEVNNAFFAVGGSSSPKNINSLTRFFDSFTLSANKSTLAKASTPSKADVTSVTPVAPVAPVKKVSNPADRWLIILQTFSKNERSRANQRKNLLRGQGYNAEVLNTDIYSNLRPGLLVLAMGPFSKRTAEQQLGELRMFAPQSYIKAAW